MPESKKERLKQFWHDRKDVIIVTTFYGGIIGFFTWITVADYRAANKQIEDHNRWANDMNHWLNDEQNAGNVVYQLADGRFLKVPNDAPQETVIK